MSTSRDASFDKLLIWMATLFAITVLVHNFDHLRRGGSSVHSDVFWVGTLAVIDEVGVVVLCLMRHRRAPTAALEVMGLPAGSSPGQDAARA